MTSPLLSFADIEQAARRLEPVVRRTPLLRSPALDALTGGTILLKAECLQRTGTFKFRGAYNAIQQSSARHVVAFSSGNHAQGVACAAQMLGKQATIVMPADAPRIKIDNTERFGATLVLADRYRNDREAMAVEITRENDAELIKPFDDRRIMAGQGTAGLEMAQDAHQAGLTPDIALICTGGGGLLSGCAVALRHNYPEIGIFAVEPTNYNDWQLSLARGKRQRHGSDIPSICDALLSDMPGELTFAVNQPLLAGALTVTDDQARDAVAFAVRELKLVLEPGGAVALAAAIGGAVDLEGKTVLVMLSGGNIDPAMLAAILTAAA